MTATEISTRDRILNAALDLTARHGAEGTSMRDLAEACGVNVAALYYHFPSKAAMLLAVYEEGVRTVRAAATGRLEDRADPWLRLQGALEGHLEAVLAPTAYARVIVTVLPHHVPEVAIELRRLRDSYELLWKDLIDDLGVAVDSQLLRLFLLGAVNSTQAWYRPGPLAPSEIAANYVSFLRQPLELR